MKGKLFKKVCDIDTLLRAWKRVKEKGASGGIDKVSIEEFENQLDRNLKKIRRSLLNHTYAPEPAKRIYIPKSGDPTEKRALALPAIKDKIVQEAVRSTIEPLFERSFLDCSYGYRQGKGPQKAIAQVDQDLGSGRTWVTSCDIDNFFDSIDHKILRSLVSETIWEKEILELIELWIKMGVVDKDRWVEVKQGIPQGNVISPLLSNIYLHQFDVEMVKKGYGLVRYADDFIILCKTKEEAYKAYKDARAFLESRLNLKLNYVRNPVLDSKQGFVFLGFLFKGKKKSISQEKLDEMKSKIERIAKDNGDAELEEVINKMNESVVGWRSYYGIGNVSAQFQFLETVLFDQLALLILDKQSKEKSLSIRKVQESLRKLEFFLDKVPSEKQQFIEQLITQIKAKPPTAKDQQNLQQASKSARAISTQKKVALKRREYEKTLSEDHDLIISTPGSFLGKTSRRIVVREKRKTVKEVPFFKVKNIVIISGGVSLSSNLIWYCAKEGIPISFLDFNGRPYSMLYGSSLPLLQLTLEQAKATSDERGLYLAKCFVEGKIKNQINLLKNYSKYKGRQESEFTAQYKGAVAKMRGLLNSLRKLNKNRSLKEVREKLFALEGQASSHYWGSLKALLSHQVFFEGRKRKGATDLVNSLLNYGYGVLYSEVYKAIILAGLNPNISFLHKEQVGKPTLVYDLVEEFRQPVVDKTIIGMIRKGKKLTMEGTNLSLETKRLVAERVLRRLESKVSFRGSRKKMRDIIAYQARSLEKFLSGKGGYRPFLDKW